jgi:hypothetical protein
MGPDTSCSPVSPQLDCLAFYLISLVGSVGILSGITMDTTAGKASAMANQRLTG